MHIRTATSADISGVIGLQSKYLLVNTVENERQNGFVTTPFTEQQVINIINEHGLFVAEDHDKIVGYAFAGSWAYFSQWPIFPYMVSRLPDLNINGEPITESNSFQYGPICIELRYRGSGLFQQLFEVMRISMGVKYPIGVTFINQINKRSFEAHTRKLQMTVIDSFGFNQHQFWSLAFKTDMSVLR